MAKKERDAFGERKKGDENEDATTHLEEELEDSKVGKGCSLLQ